MLTLELSISLNVSLLSCRFYFFFGPEKVCCKKKVYSLSQSLSMAMLPKQDNLITDLLINVDFIITG